jgi:hypothetical protein
VYKRKTAKEKKLAVAVAPFSSAATQREKNT